MKAQDPDRARSPQEDLDRIAAQDQVELDELELQDEADRIAAHGGLDHADARCFDLARRKLGRPV